MSTSYFNSMAKNLELSAMKPQLPAAQDVTAMFDRVVILELLYHLDRRHDRSHPHHNTYTGLWQNYINANNP